MPEIPVSVWWQAALLPDSWDVCGVDVPSLTLWHKFVLDNTGNHYFGGICTKDDAAALLIFAQHDYRGGHRLMLDTRYRLKCMGKMHKRIKSVPFLPTLHGACLDYVRSCTQTARRWNASRRVANPNADVASAEEFFILNRICHDYQMTQEQGWNTPYALARCLYDAGAVNRGDDSLMKPWEQKLDDDMYIAQEAEKRCQSLRN